MGDTPYIVQADALQWLQSLPDGHASLVLTDPPYNIGKADWDKIAGYTEWLGSVFAECARATQANGQLIFWHNDTIQAARLLCWLETHTPWRLKSHIACKKNNYRKHCWCSAKNTCRTWFNIAESIYCLEKKETTPGMKELVHYFQSERKRGGLKVADFCRWLREDGRGTGAFAGHWFSMSQFNFPGREDYERYFQGKAREESGVPDLFPLPRDGIKGKESGLRDIWQKARPVHNIDPPHHNCWEWDCNASHNKLHPCRKPVHILERLLRVHSNPGELVLDPFAGSGSTGEACQHTGRKFEGCELNAGYARLANERIRQARELWPIN